MSDERSPLAVHIDHLLDEVHHSLLTQDATRIETATRSLNEGLSTALSTHNKQSIQQVLTGSEVQALSDRFSRLRQAFAQSSAANARQLQALLPDRLPGAYGGRTSFGHPGAGPARRSYQA